MIKRIEGLSPILKLKTLPEYMAVRLYSRFACGAGACFYADGSGGLYGLWNGVLRVMADEPDTEEVAAFARFCGAVEVFGTSAAIEILPGAVSVGKSVILKTELLCNIDTTGVNFNVSMAEVIDTGSVIFGLLKDTEIRARAVSELESRQKLSMAHAAAVYIDGKAASVALVQHKNNAAEIITHVATLPEYRCRGYAAKVVAALANDAVRRGKTVFIDSDNPDAIRLYHKLGFKNAGLVYCSKLG